MYRLPPITNTRIAVTLIRAAPTSYADALSDDTLGRRFKRWFWGPPRPPGEVIADRTVSALELFYDLVYVAVIAQAAHPLAEHVSARTTASSPSSSRSSGRLG